MGLVLGDLPHQGFLPSSAVFGGEGGVVADTTARQNLLRAPHHIVRLAVDVLAEVGKGRSPGLLVVDDAVPDALQIIVRVSDAGMDELRRTALEKLGDVTSWVLGHERIKGAEDTGNVGCDRNTSLDA